MGSVATDYIGNGGFADNSIAAELCDGPIGVQIEGTNVPTELASRITDGFSNTLVFWESIGGISISGSPANPIEQDLNLNVDTWSTLTVIGSPSLTFNSIGTASTRSYVHSWAGNRLGNMRLLAGRVDNVGNQIGEPCSRRPNGAHGVMVDSAVRLIRRDIDPRFAFALASARGHEVVLDD
jgi:hypothetical protein